MNRGRPSVENKKPTVGFTLSLDAIQKLEAMAEFERRKKSSLVEQAIEELFERLEAKRGEPYPIPKDSP